MSRISHWTLRYAVDRVRYALHERRHRELVWISQGARLHEDDAKRVERVGKALMVDNVARNVPSTSRAPIARSQSQGPAADEHWPQVWDVVRHWRMIWTSSGVTDTAIFFKP